MVMIMFMMVVRRESMSLICFSWMIRLVTVVMMVIAVVMLVRVLLLRVAVGMTSKVISLPRRGCRSQDRVQDMLMRVLTARACQKLPEL